MLSLFFTSALPMPNLQSTTSRMKIFMTAVYVQYAQNWYVLCMFKHKVGMLCSWDVSHIMNRFPLSKLINQYISTAIFTFCIISIAYSYSLSHLLWKNFYFRMINVRCTEPNFLLIGLAIILRRYFKYLG